MDPKVNKYRSLPPLVEGKFHGYLNVVIDEIIWTKNNLDVIVLASWWGEESGVLFRPSNVTKVPQKIEDTEKTYTIKTNFQLFEEYIKNCESLELIIKDERTKKVIGTAFVVDLLDIFKTKPFTRYFPIVDKTQNIIGSIHVSIRLTNATNMPTRAENDQSNVVNFDTKLLKKQSDGIFNSKVDYLSLLRNTKQEEKMYRSILKDKRIDFIEPVKKYNFEVPEKLVEKPIPKTTKLKSALLKEALMDESYVFDNDKFLYENYHPDICPEREADLYQYFLGKEMNYFDECAVLETLRSTSPTRSLLEFATESIRCCQRDKISAPELNKTPSLQQNFKNDLKGETEEIKISSENTISDFKSKEMSPLDFVDSLQVVVRSFILSPAGYRRVKSSCLSRDDGASASATFFVQYDAITLNPNQFKKKSVNERKPVKMTSRKQIDQEILFYHQSVYNISKSYAYMNSPLKFKVSHRHINQRSPTLLGIGSMHLNEVFATKNLSMTQRVAIVNKGIKVGELEVSIELGCDGIHFGKEFIDAVMSTKENIPIRESLSPLNTKFGNFKTVTGTQSNSNSGVSSVSSRKIDSISNGTNSVTNDERTLSGQRHRSREDENMEILVPNSKSEDKVLLHGLIYIAEGRDLPESNTYVICRAFWREDRAMSRICTNTKNPVYHFHQLVPLIHGPDLLERTKDNFIVTEVYSKTSTGEDNLIGIAKFPVHQLYVAYRDSEVLSYLLLSKYPVISVDGWVLIKDPVSGQNKGQLLGLVALGTADQIALLEMTRGIRDSTVTPRVLLGNTNKKDQNIPVLCLENSSANRGNSEVEVAQEISSRNEECQTEFSTRMDSEPSIEKENDALKTQSRVLHSIVDCLAQALQVSRTNTNQASQTEKTVDLERQRPEVDSLCLDPLSITLSDNNSNINFSNSNTSNRSSKHNFNIPSEMYRSVGVGAEDDDFYNQGLSNSFNESVNDTSGILNPMSNEQMETDRLHYDDSFRAVIEIECALHLPKVEKVNTAVEPSTYVTFQGTEIKEQYESYIATNICSRTCNPRWEWRCDTRLPLDLLSNDEKKLILKVWRLLEPDISSEINLEKDIVIGFAAIDLSVLTAGFPLVSGWFHIIDFTGKCNGQIKVSVTPLESITAYGKSTSTSVTKLPSEPCQSIQSNPSNESSPRPKTMRFNNKDSHCIANSKHPNLEQFNYQPFEEPMPDIGLGFGDTSLSILSQSLKQKLTELDEITKRLQSRLHDVTENAFEDDFENDFEMNDQIADQDCNRVINGGSPETIDTALNLRETPPSNTNHSMEVNLTSYQNKNPSFSESRNHCSSSSAPNTMADSNLSDTGYSTGYNNRSANYFSSDCFNAYSVNSSDREEEHPIKGTKMHVNHLLEKLALQLNTPPAAPAEMLPMKMNIMDLLSNLQSNNNNYCQSDSQFNRNQDTVGRKGQDAFSRKSQDTFSARNQDTFSGKNQDTFSGKNQDTFSGKNQDTFSGKNPETFNGMNQDTFGGKNPETFNGKKQDTFKKNQDEGRSHEERSFQMSEQSNKMMKQQSEKSELAISSNSEKRNKVSHVIREELSQDEGNDSAEFDELSAHLIATNVRHVDVDNVFNPLLYQHLLPDVQLSPNSFSCSVSQDVQNRNTTPEGEAVQQLDNRYTETFNAAINNGLSRLRKMMEKNAFMNSDNNSQKQKCLFESESSEIFQSMPTSISEDVDGNIDITVVNRPATEDLMTSNSSESVSSASLDKLLEKHQETDDENTLSSETSTSAISRQAPDGGNPIEESDKRLSKKNKVTNF